MEGRFILTDSFRFQSMVTGPHHFRPETKQNITAERAYRAKLLTSGSQEAEREKREGFRDKIHSLKA
jgi:hypothetical protein